MDRPALQRILSEASRGIRLACDEANRQAEASGAAACLLENYSYIRSEIRESQQSFSPGFCRKLAQQGRGFRIYEIVAAAVGETEGPLTASHLVSLLAPERLRERANITLSLSELWAIAPLAKLVLIQELHVAVTNQPLDSPACTDAVESAISRLRSVDRIQWNPFIEAICVPDAILRRDPAGVYPQMEFDSRDAYRHVIEEVAESSRCGEEEVAQAAIHLAMEASNRDGESRRSHVGYYLFAPGIEALLASGPFRLSQLQSIRRRLLGTPGFAYSGSVISAALVLTAMFYFFVSPAPLWLLVLLLLPSSQIAVSLVNLGVNLFFRPRSLPRLDFSKGIPDDCRTFVVVPSLLLSRASVERLVERLEIHYLANRDRNLLFALLTDFADASSATAENDDLLAYCATRIQRLNHAQAASGAAPFYLFHRPRIWNEGEQVWMGRERKRGKLEDFNRYLLGEGNEFSAIVGDIAEIRKIRFVLTLDSDTQLPRDTAWKMIGVLAHPLNQPAMDARTGLVREGYTILQPRVSVSMESAGKSRLARIYSGQTGLDPYSRAISDVYQDMFGRATFTGKGLYDLRAFQQVMAGRFPDNSVLSHDLIEGEHSGAGLVTDVEVIDDYPATYEAYSKRKHRWIRGDWQILPWLFSRVPSASGAQAPNHLSFLSRWKIADNLRRSLFELSLFVLLVAAWLFSPSAAERVTLAAAAMLLLPAYAEAAVSLLRLPPVRFWKSYLRERVFQLLRAHAEALLTLVFLLHQALLSADAIARTLIRRYITGRRLLEWESMAQSETRPASAQGLITSYLFVCSFCALGLIAILLAVESHEAPAILVAALWLISPLMAQLVNGRPFAIRRENPNDIEFLRGVSLRTWSFFRDFSTADHHWLVPDNVQQQPYAVARRTSPTNFGLQLAANLAAFDFGYLTAGELAKRSQDLLNTLSRMERHNGHFFNWYSTSDLTPLPPRYVSTVDSGNLAAALIAFRQGCEEIVQGPLVDATVLDGLRDHLIRLRRALPASVKSLAIMRAISSLLRQLESRPTDLFFWEGILSEVAAMARRLDDHIDWACEHLEARNPEAVGEIRYWQAALQERMASVLEGLCVLAPWLAAPFEPVLRSCASDPRFRDLMSALASIPNIGELPRAYDTIQAEIAGVPREGLRSSLQDLLTRLSAAVEEARAHAGGIITAFLRNSRLAASLTREMDFQFLFDKRSGLLAIGYDADRCEMDNSFYDLLASEARIAVFLAIAKGDAPREAWFRLGRRITSFRGASTLVSWSGTMFEYLMPALFMKTFEPTLLTESLRGVVKIQQLYARQLGIPWGISEAAHSERDASQTYQYRAFGVPLVSLKGGTGDDLVVAPYATLLALAVDPEGAVGNLREMASRGWIGRYGFFESVDFRRARFSVHNRAVIVRSFMAHHQAMGLLSLCNLLRDNSMQRRFHAETMVAATELLLQERIPALLAGGEDEEVFEAMMRVSTAPSAS